MSLWELFQSLAPVAPVFLVLALACPLGLYLWGRFDRTARLRRSFGHVASGMVALGLLVMVLATMILAYLHGKGLSLVSDISVLALVLPYVFGLGNLFAATRIVPFATLKTFPLLRRVWAVLTLAAVIFGAWIVLKHTYWLIFSGIIGFLVVALVVWTLIRKLSRRATRPAPPDGDPDLFDDVAAESKDRVGRLLDRL